MDTVPLKLNIDQVGKRQRCVYLMPLIVSTICVFVLTSILSPQTTLNPSGPIDLCDDTEYNPDQGYCTFL